MLHCLSYPFIPDIYLFNNTALISVPYPVLCLSSNLCNTSFFKSLNFRSYPIQLLSHKSTIFLNFRLSRRGGWCTAVSEVVHSPRFPLGLGKCKIEQVFSGTMPEIRVSMTVSNMQIRIARTDISHLNTNWHYKKTLEIQLQNQNYKCTQTLEHFMPCFLNSFIANLNHLPSFLLWCKSQSKIHQNTDSINLCAVFNRKQFPL